VTQVAQAHVVVEYCDTHPTARATVIEPRLGLTFCGHCAQKHEGNPKLVLVPLTEVTQ
jgi:hypothetical protein